MMMFPMRNGIRRVEVRRKVPDSPKPAADAAQALWLARGPSVEFYLRTHSVKRILHDVACLQL